jgi:Spy/CpxP family protein refolding chaperone
MKKETRITKWIAASALNLMLALSLVALAETVGAAEEMNTAETGEFNAEEASSPGGNPGWRGRGRGRGFGRGMRMLDAPDLQEKLGLTEEQVEQLRALRFEGAKNAIQARSQLMLKRLELRELLHADEPNRAAIEGKLRELSDARHSLMKQRIEQRLAMREVLTLEQRSQWKKLRRQFRHRSWGPRRPGRPSHGPAGGPEGGFGLGMEPLGPPPEAPVPFDMEVN